MQIKQRKKQKFYQSKTEIQLSFLGPIEDSHTISDDDEKEIYIPVVVPSSPIDNRYLERVRSLACEWSPSIGAKVYIPTDHKSATIVGVIPVEWSGKEPGLIGYRVQYKDGRIDTVYGRQMFPISDEEISQEQHEQMAIATSLFIQEV